MYELLDIKVSGTIVLSISQLYRAAQTVQPLRIAVRIKITAQSSPLCVIYKYLFGVGLVLSGTPSCPDCTDKLYSTHANAAPKLYLTS